jgi:quinol monooxygenase YgiN
MYVSQVDFQFDPAQAEKLVEMATVFVQELRNLPGCRQVMVVLTARDTARSIVAYRTRVEAEAASSFVADFFARVAPHLIVMPQREIYPVLFYQRF